MALLGLVSLLVGAKLSAQEGPSLWGTQPISLRELRKKVTFRIIVPKSGKAYQFHKAELAWIAGNRPLFPKMPARQVACLFYTMKGYKGSIAVIQAKSLGRSQSEDNLYQSVAEGRFFGHLQNGASLWRNANGATDFMVVAHIMGVTEAKQASLIRPLFKAMKHFKV